MPETTGSPFVNIGRRRGAQNTHRSVRMIARDRYHGKPKGPCYCGADSRLNPHPDQVQILTARIGEQVRRDFISGG